MKAGLITSCCEDGRLEAAISIGGWYRPAVIRGESWDAERGKLGSERLERTTGRIFQVRCLQPHGHPSVLGIQGSFNPDPAYMAPIGPALFK